jgi:hypothetical protein
MPGRNPFFALPIVCKAEIRGEDFMKLHLLFSDSSVSAIRKAVDSVALTSGKKEAYLNRTVDAEKAFAKAVQGLVGSVLDAIAASRTVKLK